MTTYKISTLGHLGDGIIHGGDGDLIAPFALPTEEVSGDIVSGHLANLRIVTPSEHRIKPACRHFKKCGGCKLQHFHGNKVSDWKEDQVRAALKFQGIETEFLPIHTSAPNSRRRATFTARKTKSGVMLGFMAQGSETLIPIQECPVLDDAILDKWTALEKLALFAVTRKAPARLSVTTASNGLDIDIETGVKTTPEMLMQFGALSEQHRLSRISWNGETVSQRAVPFQEFDGIKVTPPPNAFLQATKDAEQALQQEVLAGVTGSKSVVDLFSGCGTFSLPLVKTTAVHAYEGSSEMVAALEQAWRDTPDLHHLNAETRDLFRRPLLAAEIDKFDAAVIDPPRAGAVAQISEIAKSKLAKLVYVSCNPSTFARDVKQLIDSGLRMKSLRVIDQFRWSNHIELVATFSRK